MVARTSHSLNPVPFYVAMAAEDQARYMRTELIRPSIGNLASTALSLMGFDAQRYLPSMSK